VAGFLVTFENVSTQEEVNKQQKVTKVHCKSNVTEVKSLFIVGVTFPIRIPNIQVDVNVQRQPNDHLCDLENSNEHVYPNWRFVDTTGTHTVVCIHKRMYCVVDGLKKLVDGSEISVGIPSV